MNPHCRRGLLYLGLVVFGAAGTAVAQEALSAGEMKKLSVEQLMDIEVTSVSRQPEKLLEAPSAIEVITGDDIVRSGATSIPEALRLADNLDVAQRNSHDWAITARGFNTELANKLLVLMDGRTIYTPLFSGVFWDRQDYLLQDLDRIEVVSGPGGTLWGANAVNGVINITSKSAKDTQGLYVEAGGGGQPRDQVAMRFGGELAPNVYYRVYGKYTERGNEALADGTDAGDASSMQQGGFRLDAEASSSDHFTLQGDSYHGEEGLVAGGSAEVSGANALGRWTHRSASGSEATLQVYYDRTHLDQPAPAVGLAPAGRLADDLGTYDVDFQDHLATGARNNVIWGFGFRRTHDVVANAPSLAFFPSRLDQNLYGGYLQDELALQADWHLTVGTKVEHNDYTGTEFEPNVRLQWTPSPRQTFWGAVSRAVRTPSRIDRDLSEPQPSYLIVLLAGSSAFESETVIAYELGYRAQLGARTTTSLSFFVNDYDDVRSTSLSPPDPVFNLPLPLYFSNNLEGTTLGTEFSANFQALDNWRLHAGFTLLRDELRVKPGQFDLNNALNETGDPGGQLNLRSSLDLPHRVTFDADFRWVAARRLNNNGVPYEVAPYAELDVRLAWRPVDRVELSIDGRNLLHSQHLEYGLPSTTDPAVEIRRTIYGKIAWQF